MERLAAHAGVVKRVVHEGLAVVLRRLFLLVVHGCLVRAMAQVVHALLFTRDFDLGRKGQ